MLPHCTTHRLERLSPSWNKRYTVILSLSQRLTHTQHTGQSLDRWLPRGRKPYSNGTLRSSVSQRGVGRYLSGEEVPFKNSSVCCFYGTRWHVLYLNKTFLSHLSLFPLLPLPAPAPNLHCPPAGRVVTAWKHDVHLLKRFHSLPKDIPCAHDVQSVLGFLWKAKCISDCPSVTSLKLWHYLL